MTDALRTLLFQSVLGGITIKPDHLASMTKAATRLGEALLENREALRGVALNAFLSGGHLEALASASTALEAEWPTFLSEVPDGGFPYLRAVAIMALLETSEKNDVLASGFYLVLVDPLQMQGEPRETKLREHVLSLLKSAYLKASQAAWVGVKVSVPKTTTKPPVEVEISDAAALAVQTEIQKALQSTAVGNAYIQNYGQNYSVQAEAGWASAVSSSIVEAVSDLLGEITTPLANAVSAPLLELPKFTAPLIEALSGVQLAERRLDVLWWMQARYSASLEKPYRNLEQAVGARQMALDLLKLVPHPAPPEVEAVLVETWHTVFGAPVQQGLNVLLKAIAEGIVTTDPSVTSPGYIDVIDALSNVTSRTSLKQLTTFIGVPGNTLIDSPALALWLFRTQQARQLLS